MSSTYPVGGVSAYTPPPMVLPSMASNAQMPSAVKGQDTLEIGSQATAIAGSATTISSQVESFMASSAAQTSSSDIVNLILLLATLKMLSGDKEDKDSGALGALMLLAMMSQQQHQEQSMVMYLSSSTTLEQTSFAASSASAGMTYNAGLDAYVAAPQAAGGAGAMDISA